VIANVMYGYIDKGKAMQGLIDEWLAAAEPQIHAIMVAIAEGRGFVGKLMQDIENWYVGTEAGRRAFISAAHLMGTLDSSKSHYENRKASRAAAKKRLRASKKKSNKMIEEALQNEVLAQSEKVSVKDALAAVSGQADAAATVWGAEEQAMFRGENELRQNLQILQTEKKLPGAVGKPDVFLVDW
jgi:hypothetical protein